MQQHTPERLKSIQWSYMYWAKNVSVAEQSQDAGTSLCVNALYVYMCHHESSTISRAAVLASLSAGAARQPLFSVILSLSIYLSMFVRRFSPLDSIVYGCWYRLQTCEVLYPRSTIYREFAHLESRGQRSKPRGQCIIYAANTLQQQTTSHTRFRLDEYVNITQTAKWQGQDSRDSSTWWKK